MLKSKRMLLAALVIVLTVLALASMSPTAANACLPSGIYRYYSSASHTLQVGQKTVSCPCVVTMTGTVTPYVVYTSRPCGIDP
jgi:hypothetical protein